MGAARDATSRQGLAAGDRLGRYRIHQRLGTAGLYVAEDTRLSRRVALEILPPEPGGGRTAGADDPAVALSHPSIVHLYSVEEADGVRFATKELVPGRPLADAVPRGGLPLERLLQVAVALADGLAAAHGSGVIHGHLSPGELIEGGDGRVRILGFGPGRSRPAFAWSADRELPEVPPAERVESSTLAYRSPEQIRGAPADRRSDVFSLGAVLYALATGRPPFTGEDEEAVADAVLAGHAPPLSAANPALPDRLGAIVARCLTSRPAGRYPSAAELLADLEDLREELARRERSEQRSGPRALRPVLACAAVAGVAALVAFVFADRLSRDGAPARKTFSQLTSDPGPEFFPSLSPDGAMVVYASRAAGNWDVHLLRVDGGEPINLTADSPPADTQPAFSPDGDRIAFRSERDGGGLFVMGTTGGDVRRLTDFGWNPSWSPDGTSLVFATAPISHIPFDRPTRSALWTVDVSSGATRRISEGDAVQPRWSPGGARIAYWSVSAETGQRDVWTVAADGSAPRPVTRDANVDWSPEWAPDGRHLYFLSDRGGSMNLWRVAIDERDGRVSGEPERITMPTAFSSHLSVARSGSRLAFVSTAEQYAIASVDFDPLSGRVVGGGARGPREIARGLDSPQLSPDGEWLVCAVTGGEQEDIVLMRPDGSGRRKLTDDPHFDRQPRWSRDGSEIAFYSNRGDGYEVWSIRPDGTGLRQLTRVPGHHVVYPVWGAEPSVMAMSYSGTSGFLFDPATPWGDQTPQPLPAYDAERGVDFVPMSFSPDGRALAGHLQHHSGVWEGVAVYSLDTGLYDTLTDFGLHPVWLPDGRRLLFQGQSPASHERQHSFREDHKLYAVDVETREVEEVLAVPGHSLGGPSLSRDGRALLVHMTAVEADIWLLEPAL